MLFVFASSLFWRSIFLRTEWHVVSTRDKSEFDARNHIRVSSVSVGTGISLSLAMAPHETRVSAAQMVMEKRFLASDGYWGIKSG